MYSQLGLEIAGHGQEPVPNTFLRQDEQTHSLVIVLPGYRYTPDMPLLYYPTELLLARGWDVLQVQYAYHRRSPRSDWIERDRLVEDVVAAARQALAQRAYKRICLLGMSLGTLGMAGLLAADLALPELTCLWLTPLLPDPWLCEQIEAARPASLFVLGTDDWCYDEATLARLVVATAGRQLVIEGGDHSLEFPGDIARSLRTVEHIVGAIAEMVE
jgi:predicted alpha/beta-hydrolase family hydrolase